MAAHADGQRPFATLVNAVGQRPHLALAGEILRIARMRRDVVEIDSLAGYTTDVDNVGCSLLMDGLRSRLSLDLQNRPTYGLSTVESPYGDLVERSRRTQAVLQYQVVA